MVSKSRNIIRGFIICCYLLIIAAIIYGISSVFGYLNTGADRSTILHTEIKKVEHYLPKVTWMPLRNEGRTMDKTTLKRIESNYLDAWYVKFNALRTNTVEGLNDFYTNKARKPLKKLIAFNTSKSVYTEGTSLSHNFNLNFFSEDGQLVVLTDSSTLLYERVYKNKTLIAEHVEKAKFKTVLLLEDGFWRIRHMVKADAKPFNDSVKTLNSMVDFKTIKGINYYPKNAAWNMYGDTFNADTIANDFKIIKHAKLNTIRIFVPYNDFGKSKVDPQKIKKLKQVLDLALENNLRAIVTLFDFYGDYSVVDWTLNQRHLEQVITPFKMHKAVLAWDIKNEPNLDFESRGKN